MKNEILRIVIVGGGAGGLELVARLSRRLKSNPNVELILIDQQLKHVWKPLLHEVAAGTFSANSDSLDYITYAYQQGFQFILGSIKQIDRHNKLIVLNTFRDEQSKIELPERKLRYDILVLAIGSKINDFNIPGVKENCLLLDNIKEAEWLHQQLLNNIITNTQQTLSTAININIIGAGATGVELAAELNYVLSRANKYTQIDKKELYHFHITLIEAGSRILSMVPLRISQAVKHYLLKHQITILENTRVVRVHADAIETADGQYHPSSLTIWAAGIKANTIPIHDLQCNEHHQILVNDHLQSLSDPDIFALGDCAGVAQNSNGYVPPRAQAAYQQAKVLAKSLTNLIQGKALLSFHYKDYGSIISLSRYNVVGNLMSRVAKNLYIEGLIARLTYWLLYQKHLIVLKGLPYVVLNTLADLILRKHRTEIKLH